MGNELFLRKLIYLALDKNFINHELFNKLLYELNDLEDDQLKLSSLENNGVEKWSGYEKSIDERAIRA